MKISSAYNLSKALSKSSVDSLDEGVDSSSKRLLHDSLPRKIALTKYYKLLRSPKESPAKWQFPATSSECTFHQLSPYIGKLKSTIAKDLILQYSKPDDLIADVFCGSGTVPLEAARLGRQVYASDVSPYATVLTKGKLFAPDTVEKALVAAERLLQAAAKLPGPDLRSVPGWVRSFFHPETLREAINFVTIARRTQNYFLLSCVLGILHHQRPGFLSFPSSHLVPYLRDKKFPKKEYPELYEYRALRPRLIAKVLRAYKRPPITPLRERVHYCRRVSVQNLNLPNGLNCLITSPPYMNALDYGRDNRLRLWFLNNSQSDDIDRISGGFLGFQESISALAHELQSKLMLGGHCIFVIGEKDTRRSVGFPSEELTRLLGMHCPSLELVKIVSDEIPDVRRARRRESAVKKEHILVFRKTRNA